MVEFCLLGSGGGMPMPFRNLSSTLLSYKGRKILIDCGEGTQVSMRMVGWGFKSIDIICITHVHGDHIIGLPGLLSTIGNSGRVNPITIIGPVGIGEVIKGLMVLNKYLPYEVKVIENPNKELSFKCTKENLVNEDKNNEIVISTISLDHSSPCLGYSFYFKRKPKFDPQKAEINKVPKEVWKTLQLEENVIFKNVEYTSDMVLGEKRKGIKLSLITDSRPIECISEFIKFSDLFICEGTYGDDRDLDKAIKNKHMTYKEAAVLAKEGEVDELILTHFSPSMGEPKDFLNNATEVFSNTKIGEDRIEKTLKFKD